MRTMDFNDILEFGREHRGEDVRALALKARAASGVDLTMGLQQVAGHRIAMDKLPLWAANDGIVYGPQLSMEQCSSQWTAEYKARLVEGNSLVDLTGGLGVDFSFMAAGLGHATYVERQENLCEIARHNFEVLGLKAQVVNGDGVEHLQEMAAVDTIYIDPARRDKAGNRVFALSDCTPDVSALAPLMLEKATTVIIKLSPMLDHRAAVSVLPCVQQVHIVSSRGECKELLLVLKRGYTGGVTVHCVNDSETMEFTLGSENVTAHSFALEEHENAVGDDALYMYEPNASIMKAGAYNLLAVRLGLTVMSADSHVLAGVRLVEDFPGRVMAVEAVGTMNKKDLKSLMAGVERANVAVRNFPLRAPELARRLKVKDGGDIFIMGTTTATGKHILLKMRRV